MTNRLETMAYEVNAHPDYRVSRRLTPELFLLPPTGAPTKTALILDVETTGTDRKNDEVIQLAMLKFRYEADGRVVGIEDQFDAFREPSVPIRPEITALTGITPEMVAGKKIDGVDVRVFVEDAALVIAHHAAFDRPFAEGICDVFAGKPWACSQSQVDWAAEGDEGTKLAYLAMGRGFFYGRHRAAQDCLATLAVLATKGQTGVTPLAQLRGCAARPTWRIWAENSPFSAKEMLKARGYRWNGDDDNLPRAWYVDVEDHNAEMEFLWREMYGGRKVKLRSQKITALERFSGRLGILRGEEAA